MRSLFGRERREPVLTALRTEISGSLFWTRGSPASRGVKSGVRDFRNRTGCAPMPAELSGRQAMTTIAEGAAAVTAALNLAKELVGVNKAFNEAEFKLKIAELSSSLATAKIALADAQEELHKKEAENSGLRKSFEFAAELIEYQGYKYRKGKQGQPVG